MTQETFNEFEKILLRNRADIYILAGEEIHKELLAFEKEKGFKFILCAKLPPDKVLILKSFHALSGRDVTIQNIIDIEKYMGNIDSYFVVSGSPDGFILYDKDKNFFQVELR